MEVAELIERIALGEDSTLELKSVRFSGDGVSGPDRRDLAGDLVAMANSYGGTVVLGVDDRNREIEGIPPDRLDLVETWIVEICTDLVEPRLAVDILRLNLPGSDGTRVPVIGIEIAPSSSVHRGPSGYFLRMGSSRREMSPDELARHIADRSRSRVIRFDESIVPGTTPDDLEHDLARRFLRRADEDDEDADVLRILKIVGDDHDGTARLTVAGALLCTSKPQRWLPHAYIQAVAYAGERTDTDYQIDARDIDGPLDRQIEEALHFVRRNMLVRAVKVTSRSERLQFGERAVFEALVNAVAHRDYSRSGMRIRLHMFEDRLELHVPGGLSNGLTTESMRLLQSNRNELIVSLLARIPSPSDLGRNHLMDKRGEGVSVIREECLELSGRLPEYTLIDDSELLLVMRAAAPMVAT